MASCIEVKSKTSTYWSLKSSMGIERISSWKFIALMVVTYRRQLPAVSKSTISCPPLSILFCLRSNCSYQNEFSVKITSEGRVKTECSLQSRLDEWELCGKCFLDWTGFIWQEWWKSLQEFRNSWTPQECKQACPFVSCGNHPRDQYDECKVNNQQFGG